MGLQEVKLLTGDVLEILPTLPAQSVQCVVTSPPYYGLRDYGTAKWEGGDPECDHKGKPMATHAGFNERYFGKPSVVDKQGECLEFYKNVCGKCGAIRIDNQIGLEQTPEEYVAKLVAVFHEVRRVLRDDGTVWLNLGSSYASCDTNPNRSLQRPHVPAYGNDGKEPQDYQNSDCACPYPCDEHQGEIQNQYGRNAHNDQFAEPDAPLLSQTDHDSELWDSSKASPVASVPDVPLSNMRASFRRDRAACVPSTRASASRRAIRSSSDDVQGSVDNSCLNYTISNHVVYKPKDLIPIPWLVAMALQADGWFLRQDVIWNKPNCMPESVKDRCTKAHEYIFLLTKNARYYYDAEAIAEPVAEVSLKRAEYGWDCDRPSTKNNSMGLGGIHTEKMGSRFVNPNGRNRRSVWTVTTKPYKEAHFATFPPDLIEPCILAGSKAGDTVLDPFSGSGTTGMVSVKHGRSYIGIDLNPEYKEMAERRIANGK